MSDSAGVTHQGQPPWVSVAGAVAGSLVVVVLVVDTPIALAAALVGAGCVGSGVWRTRRWAVTLGTAALFGAVLVVGVGREPRWLLLATVPVVLVWGVAGHAVRLGRQVGRTGGTERVALVQSVSLVVVVAVGGGIGYLGFRSATGTPSLPGVALLFASVVAATVVLRR